MMVLHLLKLASNLIMTRILVPEAFGLMAMVGVLIAGFSLFTDIGINRSIAREPDGDQEQFLRIAWVVKISRGVLISLGVLVAAGLLFLFGRQLAEVGTVYADPALPALVALSAFASLMQGFEATTRELAERRLRMQYAALLDIGSQVLIILAMLLFAAFSPTVWALMAAMLTGAALRTLGTHLFFPGPRMRFVWDQEIVDRLWAYGKWLMGSSIFTFVATNADRLILGAMLSATNFGIYVISQIWVAAGGLVIEKLADQVGFPTISEVIRSRPGDVPRLYRKFQVVIDGICLAAFLTLLFGGRPLIDFLYTPTYAAAGDYLVLLSLGFLALRYNTHNVLIMNLGNSRAMMLISAIRAVTICVALPLSYQSFGMTGALVVVALTPLVTTPYTLWLLRPVLGDRQIAFDVLWFFGTLIAAALVVTYA